jgi:hypothetical protein
MDSHPMMLCLASLPWLGWFQCERFAQAGIVRVSLRPPPGIDRNCAAGLAETIAIAAPAARPIATQALPHSDFETRSSPHQRTETLSANSQPNSEGE